MTKYPKPPKQTPAKPGQEVVVRLPKTCIEGRRGVIERVIKTKHTVASPFEYFIRLEAVEGEGRLSELTLPPGEVTII